MSSQINNQRILVPSDLDAEKSVLGSILIDPSAVVGVVRILDPDDFYSPANRHIYTAIGDLLDKHLPIDPVTVKSRLERHGVLEKVGGIEYLLSLAEHVPSAASAEYHANVVKEKSLRRAIIKEGENLLRDARSAGMDPLVLRDSAIERLGALSYMQQWEIPVPLGFGELPTFPVEAVPPPYREWILAEAEATQTPLDLPGMLSFAVVAAVGAKKFEVVVRPGYQQSVNVYVGVVLPPAHRKSGVFRTATDPIEEYERQEITRIEPELSEAASKQRILKGALKKKEEYASNAKKAEDRQRLTNEAVALSKELDSFPEVAQPRMLTDDSSPESLKTLLANHGGRMAVMSAEGNVFDMMAGMYSKTGMPNLDVYLKAHEGDTIKVDRVGRPSEHVEKPALTVAVTIQPEVLIGLAQKRIFRGRGLLGRFLFVIPESTLGRRNPNPPPVPEEVFQRYRQGILHLARLPFGEGPDGRPTANLLRFSPEASARWTAFLAELEPMLGDGGALDSVQDWAGKLAGAVARIAGTLHLMEMGAAWAQPVAVETVENAIQIGRYLVPHNLAALAMVGADPAVEDARYLLAWIRRHGKRSFTQRDAHRGGQHRFARSEDLIPGLDLLEGHGYIRKRPEAPARPGKKPSPKWDVNPAVFGGGPGENDDTNDSNPPDTTQIGNSVNTVIDFRESDNPPHQLLHQPKGEHSVPDSEDHRGDPITSSDPGHTDYEEVVL